MKSAWVWPAVLFLSMGCGSSSGDERHSTDAGTPDAAEPDAASDDADANGGFVPAPHQDPPTVTTSGGTVLSKPKIVVATFGNEPFAADIETLAKGIGATPYWSATTAEYGVGAIEFARSVPVATLPATTLSVQELETWLKAQLDGTHPEWGTPDSNTIYTLIYPKGTTITMFNQSMCGSSPAYHQEIVLGDGTHVPYVALSRCDPMFGLDGIDFVSAGLSHEWIEAATDPFYDSSPAYDGPVGKYSAWTFVTGGELADMCTLTTTVYYKPQDFPFMVQRSWSNEAALAGHDPCVPAPDAPYFNAAPAMPDTVQGKVSGVSLSIEGVKIPIGETKTIEIDLFSDAPTSGPWQVKAVDFGQQTGVGANLEFSWDAQQGSNGDKLELSVTRVKDDPSLVGLDFFTIVSTLGPDKHAWVGAVGD